MPQVSLYLNEKTYSKVRRAAEAASVSVSKWVSARIEQTFTAEWPEGFQDLFGCIEDETFIAPQRDKFVSDSARESL